MVVSKLHSQLEATKDQVRILERKIRQLESDKLEYQTHIATLEYEKKEDRSKLDRLTDIEKKYVRQKNNTKLKAKKQKEVLDLKEQISQMIRDARNQDSEKDDTIQQLQSDLEAAIIDKQELQKEVAVYRKKMELMKTKREIMKNSGVRTTN